MKNIFDIAISGEPQSKQQVRANFWLHITLTTVSLFLISTLVYSAGLTEILQTDHWTQDGRYIFLAIALSFFIMFLCAVTPLPAEAITLSNGMLFGPLAGALITWLSAMLSAYIAFAWGRYYVNKYNTLYSINNDNLGRARRWINRWGLLGFLFARLIPIVPFFALNIGAALFQISRKDFLLITGIAILPHILIICYLGDYVRHI